MKKLLIYVYAVLFAVAGFGLATAWSSNSVLSATDVKVPSISEKLIIGMDYDLIAKKIFSKFIAKYPNFIEQVSCENSDSYVDKIIKKTKIKFRKPDINKENIVKNKFGDLLRDYISDKLECDDFWYVDWEDDIQPWRVDEYVKCLFNDSPNKQSCYSSDGKWSCQWVGSCSIKLDWYLWENITWKSSCGGYAYTTIDWTNDYAKFDCIQVMPACDTTNRDSNCISSVYPWKIKTNK